MAKKNIGTQQETSLHAALKEHYARPGDQVEVEVGRYIVDIVRGNQLLEIQTSNFHLLKSKLKKLLRDYRVRVIHPIAVDRTIVRIGRNGKLSSRRKSPKHGRVEDLFDQLVGLAEIAQSPGFSLEIVTVEDEVVWQDDGQGSWRRKGWSIADRRLTRVIDRHVFSDSFDYGALLPPNLEQPFTNKELALALGIRRRLAEKMTYCLRKMGVINSVGYRQRFRLYEKLRPSEI